MQALKHLRYICFKVAFKTPVSIAIALDTTMTDEITKIRILGCLRSDGCKNCRYMLHIAAFFWTATVHWIYCDAFRTTAVVLVFCVRTYVNHVTNICQYRIG